MPGAATTGALSEESHPNGRQQVRHCLAGWPTEAALFVQQHQSWLASKTAFGHDSEQLAAAAYLRLKICSKDVRRRFVSV